MHDRLAAHRRVWEASFDRGRILEQSHPKSLVVVLAIGLCCILVPAWVEPLASAARMQQVWLPVVAYGAGVLSSLLFWVVGGRGWLGLALTFLDTAFMVTAVSLCVALSAPPISYAYASLFGLMLASVQAREYALTWPFSLACCVPALVAAVAVGVDPMEGLLLAIACAVALWVAYNTRQMRAIERQRDRLVTALRASDDLADAGVDLGLANLLLDIGHFMHEIRNAQSTVTANLQYLRETGILEGEPAEALQEAIDAQRRSTKLIRNVLTDLKGRSTTIDRPFRLDEVVRTYTQEQTEGIRVVADELVPAVVHGDAAHVEEVLHNLVRNARQAGARTVRLTMRYEAAHTAVRLRVADDGPGLALEASEDLFRPFTTSKGGGGIGLGLYLCRRRVELLKGAIEVHGEPGPGAAFDIRLPAKAVNPESNEELGDVDGERTGGESGYPAKTAGAGSVGIA